MGVPLRASKRLKVVAEKAARVVRKKGVAIQPKKLNATTAKGSKKKIVEAPVGRRRSSVGKETSSAKKITRQKIPSSLPKQSQTGKQTKRETKGQAKGEKKPTRAPRLTKKALSAFDEETLGIRPVDRGSSWDGNSDSLGSVNSGVLDENLCFLCGIATTEAEYERIVLCDTCDGEYHLDCVGLTSLPRISWTCTLCREERARFSKLRFDVANYKASERERERERPTRRHSN
jgi:hypothetical protein